MAEKMSEVYEAYDMEVVKTARGRGAFILDTDKGVRQVRQLDVHESRLRAEYRFKESLYDKGFALVDRCVMNTEGELVTYDRYGNPYVLREYFEGREINVKSVQEIVAAAHNLARLHAVSREVFLESEGDVHVRVSNDFKKRNQELKRVKNYILKRKSKKEFETKFSDAYDYFYKQAKECEEKFTDTYNCLHKQNLTCEKQSDDSGSQGVANPHIGYCHGMYNQHSLIVTSEVPQAPASQAGSATPEVQYHIATIAFDRFYVGNQLSDLYHFIRKCVEKNNYDYDIACRIIEAYREDIALNKKDMEYIYTLYMYPEKFYKLSNQYINSPKNWISPKMLEKLDKVVADEAKKQELLRKIRQNYF